MESTSENRLTKPLVAIGLIAAAAPHFFFASPLQLHLEGNMKGWLGLIVWAPAILAGIAFFLGVEFSGRVRPVKDVKVTNASLVLAPLVWLIFLALWFEPWWTQMQGLRPMEELQKVLPLQAGLAALQVLFWQGIVQSKINEQVGPTGRVLIVVGLNVAIALPFVLHPSALIHPWVDVIVPTLVWSLLIAVVAETGAQHRTTMIVAAFFGGAFIWFQQALLL